MLGRPFTPAGPLLSPMSAALRVPGGATATLALPPRLTPLLPRAVHGFQLVLGERALELLLESIERGGAGRTASAARNHKAKRTIERRQLRFHQRPRQLLG
jgi:hypothetical protein